MCRILTWAEKSRPQRARELGPALEPERELAPVPEPAPLFSPAALLAQLTPQPVSALALVLRRRRPSAGCLTSPFSFRNPQARLFLTRFPRLSPSARIATFGRLLWPSRPPSTTRWLSSPPCRDAT